MIVLIDESGDTGFRQNSSEYFVIGLVLFKSFAEAEKASAAITNLRKQLKVYPEFKFSKTKPEYKDKFFEIIAKFKFEVRAIIIKKANIHNNYLKNNPKKFYGYAMKVLIKQSGLQNSHIKIDGTGERQFKRALKSYLNKEVGVLKIKKLSFVDSKKDSLIQLADMVTGAIACPLSSKSEAKSPDRWKLMIKEKIEEITFA